MEKKGKVFLVGAGPGDFNLMTLKGLECIKKSDCIVYDRLANGELLNARKDDCELIYVGKSSSIHILSQDKINRLLIEKAKEGKTVTRLKGGDPYVFGRGGEEAEELYDEGIEFEVVPGVTSPIGGLCYAGIPITHREHASSFHIVTGHPKKGRDDNINWKSLANMNGTLVFLMGLKNMEYISERLIEEGMDRNTPTALVSWATRYNQKTVVTTLENMHRDSVKNNIESPTLIAVGGVVTLREKLNFFENKPLFGIRIGVTRTRDHKSDLISKVMDLGGSVDEIPTINIKRFEDESKIDDAVKRISEFSAVVFNSKNGVEVFFDRLHKCGFDSRKLFGVKVCSIGRATSKELEKRGIVPDVEPEKFVAESLYEKLKEELCENDSVLIVKSDISRNYLDENLKKICRVESVEAYRNEINYDYKEEILDVISKKDITHLTFTSSSTVNNFVKIIGSENIGELEGIKCVSIGPVTSETMRKNGIDVFAEAKVSTIDGMIEEIIRRK